MTPDTIIKAAFEDGVNLALTETGTMKATGNAAWIEAWLPIFREHKAAIVAELHQERRHAKVREMMGDDRRYAVLVENDRTDPVIATCAIRGLATFELAIPKHSYNGMVLAELLEKHSAQSSQPSGDAIPSPNTHERTQGNPSERTA